jgi:hypothetical protein
LASLWAGDVSLAKDGGVFVGVVPKWEWGGGDATGSFDDVHRAIGREKELKGWLRIKKIVLIESKNPRWEDLAEKWGSQMLFTGESMKDR